MIPAGRRGWDDGAAASANQRVVVVAGQARADELSAIARALLEIEEMVVSVVLCAAADATRVAVDTGADLLVALSPEVAVGNRDVTRDRRLAPVPSLVVFEQPSAEQIAAVLELGVGGVCDRSAGLGELAIATSTMLRTGAYAPAALQAGVVRALHRRRGEAAEDGTRLAQLTRCQRGVLILLVRGASQADVGTELGLPVNVVRIQVDRIKAKFGVASQRALTLVGRRLLTIDGTRSAPLERTSDLHR